jgi:hypothetical protein
MAASSRVLPASRPRGDLLVPTMLHHRDALGDLRALIRAEISTHPSMSALPMRASREICTTNFSAHLHKGNRGRTHFLACFQHLTNIFALTSGCTLPQHRGMITKDQLHIGRVSLNLNVAQLARLAGVAPNSIHGIERGFDFKASTMISLQTAMEQVEVRWHFVDRRKPRSVSG